MRVLERKDWLWLLLRRAHLQRKRLRVASLLLLPLSACGATQLPMGMGRCYADSNFAFCITPLQDAKNGTHEVIVPGSTVMSVISGAEKSAMGGAAVATMVKP